MNEMSKVLVLGASGMLGHVVAMYLKEQGYLVDTVVNSGGFDDDSIRINLMDKNIFELFLKKNGSKYDYVINAAGVLTKKSTDHAHIATYINAYIPHQLENFFKDTKTKIIHYSTDCVFSGLNGPYQERSHQDGELFYDKSKALGEIINEKDLTLRQSIIGPDINEDGIGLFNWFMCQEGQVSGYSKALWNGVTTIELAKATKQAMEVNLTGLYHFVPDENITKYALLKKMNECFHRNLKILEDSKSMNLNKTLINTRKDFPYHAPSYDVMLQEMKVWIKKHPQIYSYYNPESISAN